MTPASTRKPSGITTNTIIEAADFIYLSLQEVALIFEVRFNKIKLKFDPKA
jgi:hypothetical protein